MNLWTIYLHQTTNKICQTTPLIDLSSTKPAKLPGEMNELSGQQHMNC